MEADPRPLVLHVVHSFVVGGLENGVVNLINRMAADRWRHGILALATINDDFRRRLTREDVHVESVHKRPGQLIKQYPQIYAQLRRLRPAIVHTRNYGTLEVQVPAWAAGVPVRIHSEHGWDVNDPDGQSRRYRWLRRVYQPFVHQYITVSVHLKDYLVDRVGVDAGKVQSICNGVDSIRFAPSTEGRAPIPGCPFVERDLWLIGTVGRLQAIKDQTNLARAFVCAVQADASARKTMRLIIVGDGPLRAKVLGVLHEAGCADLAWLPGERRDVPQILRGLDLFVLPSLAEGISNTILEAMSCGLPVVATNVGGNAELVEDGVTGTLVPSANSEKLGATILAYWRDRGLTQRHGAASRQRVEERFSLGGMVAQYESLYARLLRSKRGALAGVEAA